MPIHCEQGDIAWIKLNRDQLWAEAVKRYQNGEHWWIEDSGIIDECAKIQESARTDDAWESILGDKLENRTTTDMRECAESLGIKPDRLDKSTQIRIGLVLSAIGFRRKRVREDGSRVYLYERSVSLSGPEF